MTADYYLDLKKALIEEGFANEIDWQTNIQPCESSELFRDEAIWVILNSGMKNQVARLIWDKIKFAISEGIDISKAFGHVGKVAAIKTILANYSTMFTEYLQATDKVNYLQSIPFIGGITKYHLAKNLGHDVVKPDRHLVRIAQKYGFSDCNLLCSKLSEQTGDKVSVVDIVLWRSANLGWV